MPRFFITESDLETTPAGTSVTIRGDDASHISRVLRMRPGEHVTVCDPSGREYDTVVCQTGNTVLLDVCSSRLSVSEPPYRAVVYQALVKGDRFDTVLQKSTELGAAEIVPVITSRCTVRLEAAEYARKTERWQRIVLEAAKQCGRAAVPKVQLPTLYKDALTTAAQAELPLFCYEGGGTSLPILTASVPHPETVSVMIGPEGGWEKDEADRAAQAGMQLTGLGSRILRTETAAPFVLSCISFSYEL